MSTLTPALVALILAAANPAEQTPPRLTVPFERYHLDNGLTVILHPDRRLPVVAVNIWFRVGSKDERPGRTGFAHLFEHLMFMGTKDVPNGQFDAIMEAAGGYNNATTSEDRTNYFELGPSNLLETFLWLESDRLRSLADDMTKEKVDLQRDVVKNERRQSYENRPYGMVELVLGEMLYPKGHPYRHPVIGSHADLTAASAEDVKSFFRTYYVASNASLVVAGDFAPERAKELIARYFGPLPRAPVPPHITPPPVTLARPERRVLQDAVELDQLTLVWHSPAWLAPGDAETDLLAALLGGGKSSRLVRALVYDKKIAQEVTVEQRSMFHGGQLVITAIAQDGHRAGEIERAVDEVLSGLEKQPPTREELARARAFTETRLLREIEPLLGRADMLNELEARLGDPGQLERSMLARYAHLTPSDVAWQARAILEKPRVAIEVVPKGSLLKKKAAMKGGKEATR